MASWRLFRRHCTMNRPISHVTPWLLLLCLTAAVYWLGLHGDFIFDDYPNIVTNARVHLQSLNWPSLWKALKGYEPGQIGRPLATLSFALDYYAAGKAPYLYKLTSLGVHLINTALVFLLVTRLLRTPSAGTWSRYVPWAIALLWAVHPLQVSTVLYVVQRMEMLALTFILAGLLTYLHARTAAISEKAQWAWLLASAALAALGLLGKETAALFPCFTLALELTLLGFRAPAPTRRLLRWGYGAGLAIGLLVFVIWVLPTYLAPHAFDGRNFTVGERLLTQLRVLPMYIGQVLLPLPGSMHFYYDNYPVSTGLLSPPSTLFGGLFLAALLAMACAVRRGMPVFSLGIFWFFAAHLLTSNVFNLELVFEHRNYFAVLGILLAAADLLRRIPAPEGSQIKALVVAAVIVAFGGMGILRSAIWGDPLHIAMDLVSKNPGSPRAASDLATLYVGMSGGDPQSPFYDFGKREFERAAALPGASALPEQGLIIMAASTGQPVDPAWWDSMMAKLRTQPASLQQSLAVSGLLLPLNEGKPIDKARLVQAGLILDQRGGLAPEVLAQLGDIAINDLGDAQSANVLFADAVRRSHGKPEYAAQILSVLEAEGHSEQAAIVHRVGVSMGYWPGSPDLPPPHQPSQL